MRILTYLRHQTLCNWTVVFFYVFLFECYYWLTFEPRTVQGLRFVWNTCTGCGQTYSVCTVLMHSYPKTSPLLHFLLQLLQQLVNLKCACTFKIILSFFTVLQSWWYSTICVKPVFFSTIVRKKTEPNVHCYTERKDGSQRLPQGPVNINWLIENTERCFHHSE